MDRIHKMALERHAELLRDPAHQAAMRHFEEMERNPALKMLQRHLEQEALNPLFHVTRQAMREFDRLTSGEYLRSWERRIPDWVLDPRRHSVRGLDLMFGNNREVERLMAGLSGSSALDSAVENLRRISQDAVRSVELSGLAGARDWTRVLDLSRQFTDLFRSLPSEAGETFLGQAARKVEAIRESAVKQDAEKFELEVDALASHLLGWAGKLGPNSLTAEAMLGILVTIIIAVAQVGLSYNWRVDDQRDADHREQAFEKKLEEKFGPVLSAILEQKRAQSPNAGKTYQLDRTTVVFARPGPKRPRVGYVYAGQRVLAVATTGRWIFIEYADPFNLELRAGWIRKKYANLEK
jgi:hypothetical protein